MNVIKHEFENIWTRKTGVKKTKKMGAEGNRRKDRIILAIKLELKLQIKLQIKRLLKLPIKIAINLQIKVKISALRRRKKTQQNDFLRSIPSGAQ